MSEFFYEEHYYQSHYGRLLSDPAYYELKAEFWRYCLWTAHGLTPPSPMLDYGCGLGQISAAVDNCHYFDISPFARQFLQKRMAKVLSDPSDVVGNHYAGILSSHSMEHSVRPYDDLCQFARYVRPDGLLYLVLPVEINLRPSFHHDSDRHFYTWTFQNLTNLLLESGWKPERQMYLYDSFGLSWLARYLPRFQAVRWAFRLGRLRRIYPSLYVIARKA
jgi:SAM-dependent methyltransferase